jgi:hypothetical protein
MVSLLVQLSNSLLLVLGKPKISMIFGLKAAFRQLVALAISDNIGSSLISFLGLPARVFTRHFWFAHELTIASSNGLVSADNHRFRSPIIIKSKGPVGISADD